MNITAGYLVYRTSSIDLLTALICCAPGGLSDMPMIGADLGIHNIQLIVLQVLRLVVVVLVFLAVLNLAASLL